MLFFKLINKNIVHCLCSSQGKGSWFFTRISSHFSKDGIELQTNNNVTIKTGLKVALKGEKQRIDKYKVQIKKWKSKLWGGNKWCSK